MDGIVRECGHDKNREKYSQKYSWRSIFRHHRHSPSWATIQAQAANEEDTMQFLPPAVAQDSFLRGSLVS